MNWPSIKGASFAAGFVLLAFIAAYSYNEVFLERPGGSDVDQSNYLAEEIEKYLSERNVRDYLLYASPRRSSNQYYFYRIVRKDTQDEIAQFVKKRINEENLKPAVLRFYKERLFDSKNETPIRVIRIK